MISNLNVIVVQRSSYKSCHDTHFYLKKESSMKLICFNKFWVAAFVFYGYFSIVNGEDSRYCQLCKILLSDLYDHVVERDISDDCIAAFLDFVCQTFKIEDASVCYGITSEFKDIYIYIYSQLFINRGQICETLLTKQCDPIVEPTWHVNIPGNISKYKELPIPEESAPKLKVLHISDIHYDKNYIAGSEASCNEPLCCRKYHSENSTVDMPAGKWGTAANCDVPNITVENLFQRLSKEKFDFILWTGDLPAHNVWSQSIEDQLFDLGVLYNWFKKYFPSTPIYSAVGNHESMPVDNFPPHWAPERFNTSWLYDNLAENWPKFANISTSQTKSIEWRASYSVYALPDLKIISINTQYCETNNKWLLLNSTDPDQTLQWLVQELLEAEGNQTKVYIIGHIPPGGCLKQWSWNYYDIVNRFSNTIRGQFFGHTHDDQYKLFFEDADPRKNATGVAFIAPSVTTFGELYPAYRIYEIDGDYENSTYAVLNHDNWILDVTEAGDTSDPEWTYEYNFKEAYNVDSLSPKSMAELVNSMASGNRTLLDRYTKYYFRAPTDCDLNCQFNQLCEIRSGRSQDSKNLCRGLPKFSNARTNLHGIEKLENGDIFIKWKNVTNICSQRPTPTHSPWQSSTKDTTSSTTITSTQGCSGKYQNMTFLLLILIFVISLSKIL